MLDRWELISHITQRNMVHLVMSSATKEITLWEDYPWILHLDVKWANLRLKKARLEFLQQYS